VLGDVQLVGLNFVALLEFKRAADRRRKEAEKLVKIEALLERPKFQALRKTSRQIHFYVETTDTLEVGSLCGGFSRVLPYLDLRADDRGSCLEHLIDDFAFRARSGPAVAEMDIQDCQRYLKLVCRCHSRKRRSYHPSPGLLVGVRGDGRIAFAPVSDIRDLRTTFAAIRVQERTLAREITLKFAEDIRHRHVQSISRTHRQSPAR
jgi:hypothetical protein